MGKILKYITVTTNLMLTLFCLLHISLNAHQMLYPNLPDIRIYKTDLQKIDFPIVFKMCATETQNSTARYTNVGYENSFDFFQGVSMYNKSLYGWSGHYKNGSTIASVKGIYFNFRFKEFVFFKQFQEIFKLFRHTPECFLRLDQDS